ncbi:MAG TPA: adenylate/guanylate cyclase domain-containing protein [Gammaproteobacteria bacterium]|nr:adenylate/guanylate cyclase domain-containing protein [Gammaproteobacteria bacterium]
MLARFRIPITAITLFGASALLAITVGIAIYLGFGQAVQTTRQLWADQAKTLIDGMEQSLNASLQPVSEQAQWLAAGISNLHDLSSLDDSMFGALAATPQVVGIAVILPDGNSRRWHRADRRAIDEDWSQAEWLQDYVAQVKNSAAAAWREPIFTHTVSSSTLLHDIALRDASGKFIGVLAQIVPIKAISSLLAQQYSAAGITPFVLYNRDYVLAHPRIFDGSEHHPLPSLAELGDPVLQRIWSPDQGADFISPALVDISATSIAVGDDHYLFIYRDIEDFGPAPWTIGAYVDTSLVTEVQTASAYRALTVGLVILGLAIIASIVVGRRVSAPVKAIAVAAEAVEIGDLASIEPLPGSRIRELDEASMAFNNMVQGLRERKLIRDTLGRFVPEKIASSLLAGGGKLDVQQSEATILFCDIEAFTELTETLGPVKIVEVLNAFFSRMVEILEHYGGVVTQFQGDAILATFNVPLADNEHAVKAVHAAQDMLTSVAGNEFGGERLQIRIGINTGSIIAGAIGARGRLNYTVHGAAVNLAARLEEANKQHGTRLLISEATASQLKDIELKSIGKTRVRGHSGSIKLYTPATGPDDH